MRQYSWRDGVCTFEGCISVQEADGWAAPWRIDFARSGLYPFLNEAQPPYYDTPAGAQCTGVRLALATDARRVELALERPEAGLRLDLLIDGQPAWRLDVRADEATAVFADLPAGFKRLEIWLDPQHAFRLRAVGIEDGRTVSRMPDDRPRWLHYGSSISHVPLGVRPADIWPAVAARACGLHLTNLGFRGNCHLEPMIAHTIADAAPDLITLKLGINVHAGSLNERTFGPAAIGFVRTIRERLPKAPIAIVSPLCSPEREREPGPSGLTLRGMRETLAAVVAQCRAYGDRHIRYVDGLAILGEEDASWLADGLHPDASAQPSIASRFEREALAPLLQSLACDREGRE